MRARYFLIASLVGLALFMAATPASAEGRPPEDDAYIDQDDNPTVEVGDGDDGESGDDGSSGTGDPCVWEVVIADDFLSHVYDVDGTIQHSETGRWLQKVCPGVGAVQVGGRFLIPEGGIVDVEALALQARASVGISDPLIRTSPEAGDRLYVRVPTWLWVDGGWWHSYSATASAGRVTATVSARPVAASWSFGDGGSVTCSGPGVPWRAGLPEDATDCSHTFTSSSAGQPGGTFALSTTVTLEVTWTSNIGSGGALEPISRTASQAVEVGEIQAIGTGG
jgi:hypothetical protein